MAGAATIQSAGAATTIHQSTDRAVIHWHGFSIARGETTTFVQPSASSAVLNRVTSGDSSQILGQLQANGQVYLLNPNGIYVGPDAVVNAGSFLASTHNVDEQAFQRGGDLVLAGHSTAGIRNEGTIRAEGGDVYLLARTVENAGTIEAPAGTVGLMAGTKFYLQPGAGGAPAVRLDPETSGTGEPAGTGVKNSGIVRAVQARLEAAGNLYSLAVSQRGIVQATGARTKPDGTVVLSAPGGTVEQAGTLAALDADGEGGEITLRAAEVEMDPAGVMMAAGTTGGTITVEAAGTAWASGQIRAEGTAGRGGKVTVTGARVGLREAEVEVSGETGGGTVLLGGDFQGKNPEVRNAERAFVAKDSVIRADALGEGEGGKVITWSDHGTLFYGEVSARGGESGGNGGFVEVSGRDHLDFQGLVDTRAPLGKAGTLWLDPLDLTISNSPDSNMNSTVTPFAPIATGAELSWATIEGQLLLGNVVVSTVATPDAPSNSGTITVEDSRTVTSLYNLTLQAAGGIVFGTPTQDSAGLAARDQITLQGGGSLILEAQDTITFNANLRILDNGNLTATSITGDILDLTPPTTIPPVVYLPGTLEVTGTTTLKGGNIVLNNLADPHSLQGEIHIDASEVELNNGTTPILFGNVVRRVGALRNPVEVMVATTTGDITQVDGSEVYVQNAFLTGANILLDSPANDFETLGFPLANGTVSLADQNSLEFTTTTITGTLDLVLGGSLTQSGVMNVQGNVTLNAAGDITLPLAGIPGNQLAWGAGNTVTIERARDVYLGVQNELRLDVATAVSFNPSLRNLTLRLREIEFQNSFEVSGTVSFEGTTDFATILIGGAGVAPSTALQVTQPDLDQITGAAGLRFGATVPATGEVVQTGNIEVADGTLLGFSTELLAGSGSLTTLGTLGVETASPLTSANFTVVADAMTFGGQVTVDGGVVSLRPFSPGLTIGFNIDPVLTPVDLDLSTAAANITQASSLVLGSLTQAGAFIVGGNGTTTDFQVPVTFQTGAGIGEVQLYGDLSTTGPYDLTIRGNLSPRADASVSSGGALAITGRVGGAGGSLYELTLEADGALSIGGTVSQLPLVTATGQSTTIGGAISDMDQLTLEATAGSVTLGGAVSVVDDLQITAAGGNITLSGAVSDVSSLTTTLGGSGITTFAGTIANVAALTATAPDGTVFFGNTVSGAATVLEVSAKTARVGGTISGIQQLEFTASEAIRLNGGTVTTSGNQTYAGPVVIGADTTVTSTGSGNIRFEREVDSSDPDFPDAFSLSVVTAGETRFGRAVGSNAKLFNLLTDGAGTTRINGTDVKTWRNQTFADEVILGSAATAFVIGIFNENNLSTSFLNFEKSVTGATTTVVLSEGDQAIFSGNVILQGLSVGAVTSVELRDGGTIGSAVSLGSATTRVILGNDAGDSTTFHGGLTVAAGGNDIRLAGTVGSGNGNINLSSFQLLADTVLDAGSGSISLGGFINGGDSAEGFNLSLENTGTVTLGGTAGFYQRTDPVLTVEAPLRSLDIPTAQRINLNGGAVLTTFGQTYGAPVTLGANTTVRNRQAGLIDFQSTVTGPAFTLTLQNAAATGDVDFDGAVQLGGLVTGAGAYQVSLLGGGTIGGATTFANTGPLLLGNAVTATTFTGGLSATAPSSITLTGGTVQTANTAMVLGDAGSPVQLTGTTVLATGSGNLTLGGAVSGAGQGLTLNSSGSTALAGAVGPLGSLATDAGGTVVIAGGAVTTTGSQTYRGAVTTSGDTTLTSAAAGITFTGTVQGTGNLDVVTASGAALNGGSVNTVGTQSYTGAVLLGANTVLTGTLVTLGGAVDQPFALRIAGNAAINGPVGGTAAPTSLTVSGTSLIGALAGSITTTGSQTYQGAVTLFGDTSFAAGGTVSFGAALDGGSLATVTTPGGVLLAGPVLNPLAVIAGGSVSIGAVNTFGVVDISTRGRLTLTGNSYAAGTLNLTAASLANQTGVASPFVNPGVTIVTDRPNGNSPTSLNGGFADLGYSFLPAPQVTSPGILGVMVYRFFDAPGVATELQYVETAQTFAYTAAVPMTGMVGPRVYGGEVLVGPLEGKVPLGVPGQVLPARPTAPAGPALSHPALGLLPEEDREGGKGRLGPVQPRAGLAEPPTSTDPAVPGVRVSQLFAK